MWANEALHDDNYLCFISNLIQILNDIQLTALQLCQGTGLMNIETSGNIVGRQRSMNAPGLMSVIIGKLFHSNNENLTAYQVIYLNLWSLQLRQTPFCIVQVGMMNRKGWRQKGKTRCKGKNKKTIARLAPSIMGCRSTVTDRFGDKEHEDTWIWVRSQTGMKNLRFPPSNS